MDTGDSYGRREFAAAEAQRVVELPDSERIKSRYSYLRSHGYER